MRLIHCALIIVSFALSAGCGCSRKEGLDLPTLPAISKSSASIKDRMEATPVLWNDGRLLLIVSEREESHGVAIEIWSNDQMISSYPTEFGLASALVANSRLYVFGVTDWGKKGNRLAMISTADLETWTEPVTVLTAANDTSFFNSSVTVSPDGYTLAYEVCEPNTKCFSARFLKSTDLTIWTSAGGIFMKDEYLGCPTIRYVNGFYYVFYLGQTNGIYLTLAARSTDLFNWQHGNRPVLSPFGRSDEGENNSDMDLIEHEGEIKMIYAFGSQKNGWADLRWATYKGTLQSFAEEFFK